MKWCSKSEKDVAHSKMVVPTGFEPVFEPLRGQTMMRKINELLNLPVQWPTSIYNQLQQDVLYRTGLSFKDLIAGTFEPPFEHL